MKGISSVLPRLTECSVPAVPVRSTARDGTTRLSRGGLMTTGWRLRVLAVVVALGIIASTTEAAERRAVRTMSEILLTFEHSPSPADREALEEILNDEATTACERVVARALLNVRHITSAEDKRTLEAMITDEAIPPSLRTIATVIVNLTHTVTDADRRTLKALLK